MQSHIVDNQTTSKDQLNKVVADQALIQEQLSQLKKNLEDIENHRKRDKLLQPQARKSKLGFDDSDEKLIKKDDSPKNDPVKNFETKSKSIAEARKKYSTLGDEKEVIRQIKQQNEKELDDLFAQEFELKEKLEEEKAHLSSTDSAEEKLKINERILKLELELKNKQLELDRKTSEIADNKKKLKEQDIVLNQLLNEMKDKEKSNIEKTTRIKAYEGEIAQKEQFLKECQNQVLVAESEFKKAINDMTMMTKTNLDPEVSPWFSAARFGDVEKMQKMVRDYGYSSSFQDRYGNSALHYALENKQFNFALSLLEHSIDANLVNKNRELALVKAVQVNNQIFKISTETANEVKPVAEKTAMFSLINRMIEQICESHSCVIKKGNKSYLSYKFEEITSLAIILQCKLIPVIHEKDKSLLENKNLKMQIALLKKCKEFIDSSDSLNSAFSHSKSFISNVVQIKVDMVILNNKVNEFIKHYIENGIKSEVSINEIHQSIDREIISIFTNTCINLQTSKRLINKDENASLANDPLEAKHASEYMGIIGSSRILINGLINTITELKADNFYISDKKKIIEYIKEMEEFVLNEISLYVDYHNETFQTSPKNEDRILKVKKDEMNTKMKNDGVARLNEKIQSIRESLEISIINPSDNTFATSTSAASPQRSHSISPLREVSVFGSGSANNQYRRLDDAEENASEMKHKK